MTLTYFYAQLFGILYLAIGIGMLMNRRDALTLFEDLARSRAGLFVIGIINMILGLTIVLTHNVWGGRPITVIVTLLGWILIARGLLVFTIPHRKLVPLLEAVIRNVLPVVIFVTLLLGVYFTYAGFVG